MFWCLFKNETPQNKTSHNSTYSKIGKEGVGLLGWGLQIHLMELSKVINPKPNKLGSKYFDPILGQ